MDEWAELAAYLGDKHRPDWVPGPDRIRDSIIERKGEAHYRKSAVERLYLETKEGLSSMWGPFYKYLGDVAPTAPRGVAPPDPVLLWNDPIGAVGLHLEARGYAPHFVAEPGVCTDYLKWRLKMRNWASQVYSPKSKIPRYLVLVYRGPWDAFPPVDEAAKLGSIVAFGLGGFTPHGLTAYATDDRMFITEKYRLLRWEIFNARWAFIAFQTSAPAPEPEPKSKATARKAKEVKEDE